MFPVCYTEAYAANLIGFFSITIQKKKTVEVHRYCSSHTILMKKILIIRTNSNNINLQKLWSKSCVSILRKISIKEKFEIGIYRKMEKTFHTFHKPIFTSWCNKKRKKLLMSFSLTVMLFRETPHKKSTGIKTNSL